MDFTNQNDSVEQRKQKQSNVKKDAVVFDDAGKRRIDKKLEGPNRPST